MHHLPEYSHAVRRSSLLTARPQCTSTSPFPTALAGSPQALPPDACSGLPCAMSHCTCMVALCTAARRLPQELLPQRAVNCSHQHSRQQRHEQPVGRHGDGATTACVSCGPAASAADAINGAGSRTAGRQVLHRQQRVRRHQRKCPRPLHLGMSQGKQCQLQLRLLLTRRCFMCQAWRMLTVSASRLCLTLVQWQTGGASQVTVTLSLPEGSELQWRVSGGRRCGRTPAGTATGSAQHPPLTYSELCALPPVPRAPLRHAATTQEPCRSSRSRWR